MPRESDKQKVLPPADDQTTFPSLTPSASALSKHFNHFLHAINNLYKSSVLLHRNNLSAARKHSRMHIQTWTCTCLNTQMHKCNITFAFIIHVSGLIVNESSVYVIPMKKKNICLCSLKRD